MGYKKPPALSTEIAFPALESSLNLQSPQNSISSVSFPMASQPAKKPWGPVLAQVNFDNLAKYMEVNVPGFKGPFAEIGQFGLGMSNPTYYLVDQNGGRFVCRRKPAGKLAFGGEKSSEGDCWNHAASELYGSLGIVLGSVDVLLAGMEPVLDGQNLPFAPGFGSLEFFPAHQIDREFRVQKALGEQGFPVPKVFCYCKDTNGALLKHRSSNEAQIVYLLRSPSFLVIGVEFYIMRYTEGRVLGHDGIKSLTPQARRECYVSALQTLALLHSYDHKKIGLEGYGKDKGYYPRSVQNWARLSRQQAALSNPKTGEKTKDLEKLDWQVDWFLKHLPEDEVTVCHLGGHLKRRASET